MWRGLRSFTVTLLCLSPVRVWTSNHDASLEGPGCCTPRLFPGARPVAGASLPGPVQSSDYRGHKVFSRDDCLHERVGELVVCAKIRDDLTAYK